MDFLSTVLSAEESATPTHLYFVFEEQCCSCLVVRKAQTGAMVCIPSAGIDVEHFHAAEEADFSGRLGPFMETCVVASTPLGKASKRFLDIIIFDLDVVGLECLHTVLPPPFTDDQVTGFGIHRGVPDWPFSPGLLEQAVQFVALGGERLECYETAAEEAADAAGADFPNGNGRDVHTLLDQLLAQAEVTQRTVTGMKDQFATLSQLDGRLKRLEEGGVREPGRRHTSAAAPQLFQQEPAALGEDAQDRLRELAARGPGRMGDLGSASAPVAKTRVPLLPTPADGTTGATELDGEELDGEPLVGNTLERLLASQTKLLEKLVASKTQQSDPLAILGSNAPEGDDAPKASGVKGIAARQVLMDSFRKHPNKVVSLFRERLALARRKASAQEVEPRDLWWHFQETVPLGSHRTLTYLAFISAAMFEAQERRDFARLQMLVVLQACFIEQAAYDGGALKLAHLITCLEEPPWGQTELRKSVKMDLPHGQLSDPRWIATQLAFMRDLDNMQDKSTKLAKPAGRPEEAAAAAAEPKRTPKWKPKKKRVTLEAAEEEA